MARLIYTALASLDGYIADEQGDFSWAAPDEEVHGVVNELERGVGTMLLGRRMYEVLSAWETMDVADEPPPIVDYAAIWQAADKVVYSSSLPRATTARTRIERAWEPGAVRELKASSGRDLGIGGPTLAARAFEAGLVDEICMFLAPVIVGGGLRALPEGHRTSLELIEERRFAAGWVMVRYRPS